MKRQLIRKRSKLHGQSLVEFTVTLPILLLFIVGVMEVANLIGLYTRLVAATREGARIAAAGGTDSVVVSMAQKSAQGMLSPSGNMEIWIVRPTLLTGPLRFKGTGGRWGSKNETCIYPLDSSQQEACTNTDNGVSPQTVLNDMGSISGTGSGLINDEEIVVVAAYYEARSILALPFFNPASKETGRIPLRAYTVMRQEVFEENVNQLSGGCSAYPIAIRASIVSKNGIALSDASENEVFDADGINRGNSGFFYLRWNATGTPALAAALAHPGSAILTAYQDPEDAADIQLHRRDKVLIDEAALSTAALDELADHDNVERSIRVVIFDTDASSTVNGLAVTVSGFAVVKIDSFASGGNTITFKFVRHDGSCGFDLELPSN